MTEPTRLKDLPGWTDAYQTCRKAFQDTGADARLRVLDRLADSKADGFTSMDALTLRELVRRRVCQLVPLGEQPGKDAPETDEPFGKVYVTRQVTRHNPRPHDTDGGYRDGICQPDGAEPPDHYCPDRPIENAALRHSLGQQGTESRYWPLGDLITHAVTFADPLTDTETHPEAWQTFEQCALKAIELETRALAIVMSHEGEGDDAFGVGLRLSHHEAIECLMGLSRRMVAIVELSQRFRTARWGDPRHGGHDPEETRLMASPWFPEPKEQPEGSDDG
jgi:hypothetical protein